MPARRRRQPGQYLDYPHNVLDGAWRQRGFAFHLMYEERDRADMAELAVEVLRDRVEVIVPAFLDLLDDVLHERNCAAFAKAWRVQRLVDDFLRGAPGHLRPTAGRRPPI